GGGRRAGGPGRRATGRRNTANAPSPHREGGGPGPRGNAVRGHPPPDNPLPFPAPAPPPADTPPFSRTDPVIPGIGHVSGFAEAAFALNEGQVSDLIETDDAIYLLSPFEHVDAHTPTVADVRDRLVADTERARGQALAREKA